LISVNAIRSGDPSWSRHPRRIAMTSFSDREQAFEAKYAHDEELRFLVSARRDKQFAHWAAAEARLSGADEDALVASVVHIQDGPGHEEALLTHVAAMLAGHGAARPRAALVEALEHSAKEARQYLMDHPPAQTEIL
jgi:hypothetical protein